MPRRPLCRPPGKKTNTKLFFFSFFFLEFVSFEGEDLLHSAWPAHGMGRLAVLKKPVDLKNSHCHTYSLDVVG